MKEYFSNMRGGVLIPSGISFFWKNRYVRYALTIFFGVILLLWFLNSPPHDFPVRSIITVEEGESLAAISQFLKGQKVIRSEILFEFAVIIRGGERRLMAGDYFFANPAYIPTVARRLTHGEYGITPIRVTIPEGSTVMEIAAILKNNGLNLSEEEFIALAKGKEGFLFPDTYFFLPNTPSQNIIDVMAKNFERKTIDLESSIERFGKTLEEVVTMASIIEREVMTPDDRRIVSGILWKRIAIGMPLQVDAAFIYVNGTTTPGLSLSDLKIDSPYNTYLYKGLPAGPIGNPGIDSLRAAIEPKLTPYLYYLSDSRGVTYYAQTFEEHKDNKRKHL